jgi:predicted nucleic-acid-binding protein
MIAIDTNVLVRVLVDDPGAEEQCRLARELIAKHDTLWVNQIVLIEAVWVLQTSYRFDKTQIALVLEKLSHHPHIRLENDAEVKAGLELFVHSNVGFSDCLIINDAQSRQLVLYTFDRKLSRLHGAKGVGNE